MFVKMVRNQSCDSMLAEITEKAAAEVLEIIKTWKGEKSERINGVMSFRMTPQTYDEMHTQLSCFVLYGHGSLVVEDSGLNYNWGDMTENGKAKADAMHVELVKEDIADGDFGAALARMFDYSMQSRKFKGSEFDVEADIIAAIRATVAKAVHEYSAPWLTDEAKADAQGVLSSALLALCARK